MTDTNTSTRQWPANLLLLEINEEERRAVLRVQSREALVFRGDLSGWTLRLDNHRGNAVPEIRTADSTDVTLELSGGWTGCTEIDSPDAVVRLTSRRGSCIRLAAEVREVQVRQGAWQIDGDIDYVLRVDPSQGARSSDPIVSGNARIRRLTGEGPIEVSARFVAGSLRRQRVILKQFSGQLTVRSNLAGAKLIGDGVRVSATNVVDSHVEVDELTVRESIQRSHVVTACLLRAGTVADSDLEVLDPERAAGLVIGKLATDPAPVSAGVIDVSISPILSRFSGGSVTNCRLTCGEGDIYVGQLSGSTVSVDGSVICAKGIKWPGQPEVNEPVLQATGHLHVSDDVTIDDDSIIDVDGEVYIGRTASGGTLRAGRLCARGGLRHVEVQVSGHCRVEGELQGGSLRAAGLEVFGSVTNGKHEVGKATIGASQLVNRPSLLSTYLLVHEELDVAAWDGSDAETTIELRGSASLPAGFGGVLLWTPTEGRELALAAPPRELVVRSSGYVAEVTVPSDGHVWPSLTVEGSLVVKTRGVPSTPGKRQKGSWTLEQLRLGTSDSVLAVDLPFEVDIQAVEAPAEATIERRGGDSLTTFGVKLDGAPGLVIGGPGRINVSTPDLDKAVLTVTDNAEVRVDGELKLLVGRRTQAFVPILHVPEASVVHELRGDITLGVIAGRVEGPAASVTWWHRPPAPKIHGIESQREPKGYVVAVDPTAAPYAELENTNTFHVFEPEPKALIRWAKKRNRKTHEARTAAAKAQRIAEQVTATAASGGARSAALWAAARTHHAAVRRLSLERVLRWVHQQFGYSQRPAPALRTYLIAVVTWSLLAWRLELVNQHPKGLGEIAQLAGRIAVLPASWLLRIPGGNAAPALFENFYVGVAAFLTTGLPFIFFVIALRNFMAAPDGSKR